MGSPLGPTLANVFLCHWEEIWLKKCPVQFQPKYYNRFMDDTFLLFSSQDHVLKFHKYINSRHKNMRFTYEIEKNNSLAFLDVLVTRENTFCTSLHRKPTFSGLYTNFNSFMPDTYKKVSFTRCFIELSHYVVIGINFIWKWVFSKRFSGKTYFLNISLIGA